MELLGGCVGAGWVGTRGSSGRDTWPGRSTTAPADLFPLVLPICSPPCCLLELQDWIKGVGKAQGRKGKRLFMPMRIAFTGRMAGPDVGDILCMLALEDGDVADMDAYVPLDKRMEQLRAWLAANPAPAPAAAAAE